MKAVGIQRKPKMRLGAPVWWHRSGEAIEVVECDPKEKCLSLSGNTASVKITHTGCRGRWLVEWKVTHTKTGTTEGHAFFKTDELRAAFGLSDKTGDYGDWLIEEFGASSAEQGKFIRWNEYLNIPCPGTGHDGDPNVSLLLSSHTGIKEAVLRLLG